MTIDWWTLGLQTVNVLILIWLLARFLFQPVTAIIAARQAAASAELDAARATLAEAEHTRDAARHHIDAIEAERATLVEQAVVEARHERARLLEQAEAEAQKARAACTVELAYLRRAQEQELAVEAGELAADIAARLFARLPDEARIAGFVEGLGRAVEALPAATRSGIGSGHPVHIRAPRALTADEAALVRARLEKALGRRVEIGFEVAPELIAGLELDGPLAIVRNHFRADLDRIRQELAKHD